LSKTEPIYFCNQCKKIITALEDLLFVEDGVSRGFCSEKCIEQFFMPIVQYFEKMEKNLRSLLRVDDRDEILEYINDVKMLD